MGKVGRAVAGVLTSATVLAGAYGIEAVIDGSNNAKIVDCGQAFADEAGQKACIEAVQETADSSDYLDWVALAGAVGVVGCGYLGYKAVKEENQTTGIIDDYAS